LVLVPPERQNLAAHQCKHWWVQVWANQSKSTSLGRRCRRAQRQLQWPVQLASSLSVAPTARR